MKESKKSQKPGMSKNQRIAELEKKIKKIEKKCLNILNNYLREIQRFCVR